MEVEGKYIFFHYRGNVFSSAEKLFMHEQALFASDLLKAREIMGEDMPWELWREVRWLNEGEW